MKYLSFFFNTIVDRFFNTRFIVITLPGSNEVIMVYDTKSKLLWQVKRYHGPALRQEAEEKFRRLIISGIDTWQAATSDMLIKYAKTVKKKQFLQWYNPGGDYIYIFGKNKNMLAITKKEGIYKSTETGVKAWLLGFSYHITDCLGQNCSIADFIEFSIQNGWDVEPQHSDYFIRDISDIFENLDYFPARLPFIEESFFTDPNKGIWEFWNTDIPEKFNVRARNPVDDIRPSSVAIDFGTSSTVVAIEVKGKPELLRIGVKNFHSKPEPKHYENPTVLELINIKNTLAAWQEQAYRPAVSWDDVRCSHEALNNFHHNEANPKVVTSILVKIKQWALREASGEKVRITDQENGEEHILAPLTLRQTVKGQPIAVSNEDPFDPLELYAWFLGLNINWRGRGIFLNYAMTFPVAYPKEVREKILASFSRGLQRSLPQSLVDQPEFARFSVEERATEPAAYAAAAMPKLSIEPTAEGVAYAVFDFGGGTTDFDFGYYRLTTEQEEDDGYEEAFEHVGASGDRFLGGENLLENMAYRVFQDNLDICREKKIAFTRPLDADDFAGSEMSLDRTQAAHTNTIMLMARLRPIWEEGAASNSSGIEKLELLDRKGNKVSCEFSVDEEKLLTYLEQRIAQGIKNFYVAMYKYFTEKPDTIHVLLAGNSSRSKWVADYFGLNKEDDTEADKRHHSMIDFFETLFGGAAPKMVTYNPLPEDKTNPYAPTAKTGVALGLLSLRRGSAIKVINRNLAHSNDDAPFHFYVGHIQRRKFVAGLKQGAPYGEFVELGPIRERIFELVHTQSPRANTGEMPVGDPELTIQTLEMAGNTDGYKLFAKITGPATIEVCSARSLEDVHNGLAENQREIKLR